MKGLMHLYNNIDKDFFKLPDNATIFQKMDHLNWEYKTFVSKQYVIGKLDNQSVYK
jgi:hypothetical protein